jgi:hypothetical protein
VIQAGFSFVLSIWFAIIDGSLMTVLRGFIIISSKLWVFSRGAHYSWKKIDVLYIPHQLQKLYIEKMSETISDVQTLNGKKIFALAAAND